MVRQISVSTMFLMFFMTVTLWGDVSFIINYSDGIPEPLSENQVEDMVTSVLDLSDSAYFEARVIVNAEYLDVATLRRDTYAADLYRLFVEDKEVTEVSQKLYDDLFEYEEEGCPLESYSCPDSDVQILVSAVTEVASSWQNGRRVRDALQEAGINVVYLEADEGRTEVLNYLSCPNLKLWGRIGHGDQRGNLHLEDGTSLSPRDITEERVKDRVFPINSCYVGGNTLASAFMDNDAVYMSAGDNVQLYMGSSEPAWRDFVINTVRDSMDIESAWQIKQNESSRDDWALNIRPGGPHHIDLDGPAELTLLSPSKDEELMAESEYVIRWESEGEIENVHIEWSHAGGEWSSIESSAPNSGTYTWNVPDTSHDNCALRISEVGGDASDEVEYFSIIQKPAISVPELVIDTSLRNNEEAHYDLDIANLGRGVLNASISQTASPSDFIEVADWSGDADDFGSEIDTGDGIIQNGTAVMGYSIVEQPDDDSWPWAIMTASPGQDFTGVETIEITYSSNHEISLLLDQTGLSENGTSHRAVLAPGGSAQDTVLHVPDDFSQPDWVEEETSLDLSKVESASFSISPEYTSATVGTLKISSLSLVGMDLPDTESPVSLDKTELEIGGESRETVRILLSAENYDIGEYSDTVVISHNDPDADAVRIPVRLEIRENRSPEFDNVDTQYSLDPGDNFTLEVSASDPDDDEVILTVENLPEWLTAEDSEPGVMQISGRTDDSHAEMDYTFQVAAMDTFEPAGQAQLEITIQVGTDIVQIDTISGENTQGIFPARNPESLSADTFVFTVLTGAPATVRIVIYDNLGNILDEQDSAGSWATGHVLSWDMRNSSGQKVGAGSYLIAAEVTYEDRTLWRMKKIIGLQK
ncbi:MAG: hypothetical protein ACQEQ4_03180 [Fibrobacterota bacterium]